jgi:hypothetical protein
MFSPGSVTTMASNTQNASDAVAENPLYKGSCHCGFITYTVRLDLAKPSTTTGAIITKCNCSICHKSGLLLASSEPVSSFALLTPVEGEAALTDYTFSTGKVHHWLCPRCGIKCFLKGSFVRGGKEVNVMKINVLTLDGKADGSPMEDLREIKPLYWNGRNPGEGLAHEPWEGGVW